MGGGADNRFHIASRQEVMDETFRAEVAEVAEHDRAHEIELALAANLANEIDRAEAAEAGLGGAAIDAEVTRAEASEAALGTAITDETTRAEAAESTLGSSVSAETTRAEVAEAAAVFSGTVTSNTGALIVQSANTLQQAKMSVSHLLTQATVSVAGGTGGASQVNMVAGTSGGVVSTTDNAGSLRNSLDDGSGNAVVAGTLTVDGVTTTAAIAAAVSTEATSRAAAIGTAISTEVTNRNAAIATATSDQATLTDGVLTRAQYPGNGPVTDISAAVVIGPSDMVLRSGLIYVRLNGVTTAFPALNNLSWPSDPSNPHIDSWYLHLGSRTWDAFEGTPAASPVAPNFAAAATSHSYDINDLMRAFDLLVPAGVTLGSDCTIQNVASVTPDAFAAVGDSRMWLFMTTSGPTMAAGAWMVAGQDTAAWTMMSSAGTDLSLDVDGQTIHCAVDATLMVRLAFQFTNYQGSDQCRFATEDAITSTPFVGYVAGDPDPLTIAVSKGIENGDYIGNYLWRVSAGAHFKIAFSVYGNSAPEILDGLECDIVRIA